MLGDLVVLATDVFTTMPAKPTDVVVQATVFDGRVVYERANSR
jgi:predicted amidohydrolase YtcJ